MIVDEWILESLLIWRHRILLLLGDALLIGALLLQWKERPQSMLVIRGALRNWLTAIIIIVYYWMVSNKSVMRTLQIPHCLLWESLRVYGRVDSFLARGRRGWVLSDQIWIGRHPVLQGGQCLVLIIVLHLLHSLRLLERSDEIILLRSGVDTLSFTNPAI